MKKIDLPSGAKLVVSMAPFAQSKALYQALLEDLKSLNYSSETEIASLVKDVFCIGFSSKKIETCLNVCMARCTYNDLKIDENTFEPEDARQDYIQVCYEVALENVMPFTKTLTQQYKTILAGMISSQT